jgi:hypothetical protein
MARSNLTLALKVVAYCDSAKTSNPQKTPINWGSSMANLPFENAGTLPVELAPGATATVLNGTRSLTVDNTTVFSLTSSPLSADRYRLATTGGAAPGFRTARAVSLNGIAVALVVNQNLSVTATAQSGSPFSAVQAGDVVFIPGLSTGDPAGPFNSLNEGWWTVLTASSTVLVLTRGSGPFSAQTETVTPTDDVSFFAFSPSGTQIGDTLSLSSGFAASALSSFEILAVTAGWVEFQSLLPLANQTGIEPGSSGIAVYTSAKRFLLIETDQEIAVRLNGGTDSSNIVSPILPGNCRFQGPFLKFGPVWQVTLINRSSAVANVTVISAE